MMEIFEIFKIQIKCAKVSLYNSLWLPKYILYKVAEYARFDAYEYSKIFCFRIFWKLIISTRIFVHCVNYTHVTQVMRVISSG